MPKVGIWLAAAVMVVLLSACNEDATPTSVSKRATATLVLPTATLTDPGPAMTATADNLAVVLGQFTSAQAITIQDDWSGLAGPTTAHYSLLRNSSGYSGTAVFSANKGAGPQYVTSTVTIPLDVAQNFLSLLAQAPLQVGAYTPKIEHTDDYPSVSIELQFKDESVRFYSQSQGIDHIPWGADISSEKYSINSGVPAQAYANLGPYLKRETLHDLEDKVRQDLQQAFPTP